jgi:hypothetical protein
VTVRRQIGTLVLDKRRLRALKAAADVRALEYDAVVWRIEADLTDVFVNHDSHR